MHLHKVKNDPLKPLQGVLTVLLLVGAVLLDSFIFQLLTPLLGEGNAALLFWAFGVLIVLWAMRRFVLTYSYGLSGTLLRITFAYGRYERVMEDIYLNNIVFAGDPSVVRQKHPSARVRKATRPGCPLPHYAVAHRDNGKVVITLLQPDDAIREALAAAARGR
ncbi:MAG: hypothetical protein IJC96_08680 [Clostridia bacterium]|nr:hypothetical protein [Clostridia bacterium]